MRFIFEFVGPQCGSGENRNAPRMVNLPAGRDLWYLTTTGLTLVTRGSGTDDCI
jgi:hypothetical protein